MLDSVESTSMSTCPKCSAEFTPSRSNQKYCSKPCQKATARNTSRGSRTVENKARSGRHYERASRLAEMVYSMPREQRLGVVKDILSFVSHDAGLRNILTDVDLLKQAPRKDQRKTIAQVANIYAKMFFGMSITAYVRAVREGVEVEGIECLEQYQKATTAPAPSLHAWTSKRRFRCNGNCHPESDVAKARKASRKAASVSFGASRGGNERLNEQSAEECLQYHQSHDAERVDQIVAASQARINALPLDSAQRREGIEEALDRKVDLSMQGVRNHSEAA